MIKICELVKRRPGMSVEEFQTYWMETHGPIVARIPGIRRYVQSHPLAGGYKRGPLPFDGVAEIWVDDKDALRTINMTTEFEAAKQDEPNFIDTGELIELLTVEHVIKDLPAPSDGLKSLAMLNFRNDIDPGEAQRYWREVHGPIAAENPHLGRYVQCHLPLGAYRRAVRPAFDGIAVAWFESIDAMRASEKTDAYKRTRADEPNFLDTSQPIPFLITREHVVID